MTRPAIALIAALTVIADPAAAQQVNGIGIAFSGRSDESSQRAVLTYEDRGVLKLGEDRTFEFKVVQTPVSSELVTFLLERIDRPIVSAVLHAPLLPLG